VTSKRLLPPFRELAPARLLNREQHLLHEIQSQASATPRFIPWLPRRAHSLVAAAVLVSAVVGAPALAFSSTVRELVGLSSSPPVIQRWVQATLTGTIIDNPNPRPGMIITVTWTIGAPGKPRDPGFGGTGLFMRLLSKTGPTIQVPAHGSRGRYSATTRVPAGGIKDLQLGIIGYSDGPTGHHSTPGLFPITNNPY
jgi:hypothetical protein